MVGILDYGLAKVADLLAKYVTTPVTKCRSTPTFIEKIDQELGHILEAVLEMVLYEAVIPEKISAKSHLEVSNHHQRIKRIIQSANLKYI